MSVSFFFFYYIFFFKAEDGIGFLVRSRGLGDVYKRQARFNSQDAGYERIHRALLSGLLGNIGSKNEEGDYDGPRGIRFAIHPSSGLRKRQPRWLVASELVENSRPCSRVPVSYTPLTLPPSALV